MKKFATLSLVFALLFTLNAISADYEFKVNTVKGNVQVKQGSDWTACKKGSTLSKTAMIKVGQNGYVGLVHKSGDPVEVNKSGNYSVSKLASKAGKKKGEVTKKFTKFIMDELGESDDLLASDDFNENMATLGAVERAMFYKSDMNVRFPRSSYTIQNIVNFSWYEMENAKEYTFFIKSPDDEVIFEQKVIGTDLNVDLNTANIGTGECFYWGVKANGKTSEEYCLYRMNTDEKSDFNSEMQELMNEIDSQSSIGQLIMASFYSENQMVNEARTCYEKAIEISPEVDNFKALYAKYLIQIGLSNEAEDLVKNN